MLLNQLSDGISDAIRCDSTAADGKTSKTTTPADGKTSNTTTPRQSPRVKTSKTPKSTPRQSPLIKSETDVWDDEDPFGHDDSFLVQSELVDTPSVRGMIRKVAHLIKVEELS